MENVGLMAALAGAMTKAPTAEQVTTAVDAWLDDHPEATTTVQDSSITRAKLDADLKEKTDKAQHVDDLYYVTMSDNLANPSTIVTGSLNNDGTVDSSATSYITSDFIEIEENTDYTVSCWATTIKTSRKHLALYDQDKQYIASSYQNVNSQQYVSFNSGSAKYVRASCGSTNVLFVKKGSAGPSEFVSYNAEYHTDMVVERYKPGTVQKDSLSASLNSSIVHTEAAELFDPGEVTEDAVIKWNGDTQASDTYNTSGFIPVTAGKSYNISTVRIKAFYTEADASSFIDGSYDNTEHATGETFLCAYTGYMRFSFVKTATDVSVITVFEGTPTRKIEEGISLSEYNKEQVQEYVGEGNILYGKKWAVCGDSFTNSGGTGTVMPVGTKYAGQPYTYPWIIGSRQNMDIVKFFDGGRTLAFPAQPGTFANSLTNPSADWYYQNIPADADYITIYLGINDEHHAPSGSQGDGEDTTGEIPLGTISDATTETYLGAWNVVLSWLITNRPNAHIGMIVTNGIAGNDLYRQGQIAIAEKYGIPYIDMNGDARTPAMLRTSNPNIAAAVKAALIQKWAVNPGTNEHPNDAAQLFESTFIENFLRSI